MDDRRRPPPSDELPYRQPVRPRPHQVPATGRHAEPVKQPTGNGLPRHTGRGRPPANGNQPPSNGDQPPSNGDQPQANGHQPPGPSGGRRRRAEPHPAAAQPTRRRPHPAEAHTEVIQPVRPAGDEPTEWIQVHRGDLRGAFYQEPETQEVIEPVTETNAEPVDEADLFDDGDPADPPDPADPGAPDGTADAPAPRRKAGLGATVVKAVGELMVTAGVLVLLFVVYEVWITDLMSAEKQRDVTSALDQQWQHPPATADPERSQRFEFADGEGMAKLYIPALGEDYRFTVVEGTTEADLEVGPGHYKNSALPGQPGNFSVAGHRVGKGAPFNDLDLLQSCDAIVVETETGWFVYRLLPTVEDAKDWAARGADPLCAAPGSTRVEPLTGAYAAAVGRQIVTPKQSEVVAPVPGNAAAKVPDAQRRKLITLTTCHPKFSNRQRMILHGELVREQPKNPAEPTAVPVELRETR
ncbi:class E sortase [Actinokineospora sp. NBRC 105648]|uniref:class E sortase n=1 Tax=Actinokineospora sp. NBRC 105648 TaxID=3032206 RepID=UPI0024A0B1C1|nr:class E sortase [Actinokineospora sp. NBRC 105648]GLZ42915.1 class E sortase [Actinokineospora sp. NBRC 105648]